MQYDSYEKGDRLSYDPFLAIVGPRPIAWISTVSPEGGANLAPYSFYNALSAKPPYVMFSSSEPKDSLRNAEREGCFVVNYASVAHRNLINESSRRFQPAISEAESLDIEMVASSRVRSMRVKGVPAALECVYVQTVTIDPGSVVAMSAQIVIGKVVSIFIDDSLITPDGRFDVARAEPLMRAGYRDFAAVAELFDMPSMY